MQLKCRVHLGGDLINAGVEDVGIDVHGSGKLSVAEELLGGFVIDACFMQGGRVAVADLVRGDGDTGALLVLSLAFLVSGSYNPFLYFRF